MSEIIYGAKFESIIDMHKAGEKISVDISRINRFDKITFP